jgi:hypothetical protein
MSTYHELAEAIRKGAALRPQATMGEYFALFDHDDTALFASCALGAAWEGTAGPFSDWDEALMAFHDKILATHYACLNETAPRCPFVGCNDSHAKYPVSDSDVNVEWMINHLNEDHKLLRETIADWLDTL